MKVFNLILPIAFLLISQTNFAAIESNPRHVVLGMTPGEDPEVLKKNGVQLAKILQNKLDATIDIFVSKDYAGLIEAMKQKKVDFAFFTANTFVEAESAAGAKVLLKKVWEKPFYSSVILTLKTSGFKKPSELKGKRFGFVDEKSTSGYLYPSVELQKQGINSKKDFSKIKFYGQHEKAVQGLLSGEVDAIAVFGDDETGKTGAWTRYAERARDSFEVIWVSEPIPNDPFCVREDFYDKFPKFTHSMMFALLDFNDATPDNNYLKKLLGVNSVTYATSRQYEPVRELQKYLQGAENSAK